MSKGYSVFARGRKLYVKIKDVQGRWIQKRTGFSVGQEAEAERLSREFARRIEAERKAGASGPLTVADYARTWIERRKVLVDDWKNDEQRLRAHVLPTIGHMTLADVDAGHLVELFAELRSARRLAQRTIYNVYSVVAALFRDARLARLVTQTPAILTARELGPKVDKDPTQRGEAVFTRLEVERLVSDPRVPEDRQVVYAFGALAGLRHGEVAGLRWRHVDPDRRPLGMLTVATSYDKGRTKTGRVRRVPIHPAPAAILGAWLATGWPGMFGRRPQPDDLIVPLEPDPPRKRARANPRGGGMRSKNDSRKRLLRDLAALDLRHRRGHDLRATFITLAEEDGADPAVIARVTHSESGGHARDAFDGYRRTQWETKCREVAKLVVTVEPARLLGAGLVQVADSSSTADSYEWRRRESNAGAVPRGDTARKQSRAVDRGRSASKGVGRQGAAPNLVQSACDLGLMLLRASAPNRRRHRAA